MVSGFAWLAGRFLEHPPAAARRAATGLDCPSHSPMNAAEHDVRVFETGISESEMIEPMRQRRAGDGDLQLRRVGEVGQPKPARRMLLAGR